MSTHTADAATESSVRRERPADAATESLALDFLAYLELERGLSRNTLEAYRGDLLQLGEFLRRRGVGPLQAGHSDLAAFLAELAAGTNRSRETLASDRSGETRASGANPPFDQHPRSGQQEGGGRR